MLKRHKITVVRDLTHVQIIDSENWKFLLKSLYSWIFSRNVAFHFVALRAYALNKWMLMI